MRRSVIIAAAFAVLAMAWILSGQFDRTRQPAQADTKPAAEAAGRSLPAVRVRIIVPRRLDRARIVNGRTEASRVVDLRAELDGRIVEIGAREGDTVKRDAVIARIATEDRKARLAHAAALLKQRELEYQAAIRLSKRGFRANTKLAEARAYRDSALARLARMRIDLRHTVVRAPFDGVLEFRTTEVGAFVKVGDTLARIVDLDPVLVVGHVSERGIADIAVGAKGRAVLADGARLQGIVRFVGSVADPQTRTFKVELEISNQDLAVRAGVTAELSLPRPPILAHKISPALLTLNDAGLIGVKIVEAGDIVRFVAIEILGNAIDGIWIGGLDERVRLITVGHEFVETGQRVRPIAEAVEPVS